MRCARIRCEQNLIFTKDMRVTFSIFHSPPASWVVVDATLVVHEWLQATIEAESDRSVRSNKIFQHHFVLRSHSIVILHLDDRSWGVETTRIVFFVYDIFLERIGLNCFDTGVFNVDKSRRLASTFAAPVANFLVTIAVDEVLLAEYETFSFLNQ